VPPMAVTGAAVRIGFGYKGGRFRACSRARHRKVGEHFTIRAAATAPPPQVQPACAQTEKKMERTQRRLSGRARGVLGRIAGSYPAW
jgi:hypothetical protein